MYRSRSIVSILKGEKIHSRFFSSTDDLLKSSGSSSQQWLQRQRKDPFVKSAQKENYRCRSAFKLLQIDDKFRFLQPGSNVIDCGASPGSWTEVAVERVNSNGNDTSKPRGLVIGIDLKHISPIEGAILLPSCDFTRQENQDKIRQLMEDQKAHVVLSDMAPNATGVKSHNHEAIVALCFSVLRFSLRVLHKDGTLLCKLWMGEQQKRLEKALESVFDQIRVVKPKASRNDSAEIFILAQGFLGLK